MIQTRSEERSIVGVEEVSPEAVRQHMSSALDAKDKVKPPL